ncbi:DUF1707 domain-containing protein [Streptomyces albidoflavus]|uniref:DUF1707 SHOCT-like domain-containing protein n=1 Tax=Streptomyces TaxID=1883 RepID=UPI001646227A|nr:MULTISPECIES: DUF1707 domain-containing protein [Streptomyces]MDI3346857.1 DUF1707 domain-containing protein [Streptomyces sp. AJ-1]
MSLTSGGLGGALPEEVRDGAVRRLQEAYAAGALTYEEMDRRLGRALEAGTPAELEAVVAGLPVEAPASTGVIVAAGGRITRRGAWRVPRFLKVGSAFGRVRLDLSRAVFDGPEVEIALELGTGGARIVVPRDAVVELDGVTTGWKDLRYRPRQPSRPGGPVVRVTGAVGFGRLRVRHAWFRWRQR